VNAAPAAEAGTLTVAFALRGAGPCDRTFVSDEERAASEHLIAGRRQEFREGRALLRWALCRHLGLPPESVVVRTEPGGRPVVADRSRTHVTVSHSATVRAVAVVDDAEVGIDVESTIRPEPAFLRRCCSREDREALAVGLLEDRARALTVIWTVQEACVKATGEGLRGRPGRVRVPPGRHRGRWRDLLWSVLPSVAGDHVAIAVTGTATGRLRAFHAPEGRPMYDLRLPLVPADDITH
jgi:4'-phosphopantetheinyl transferase